MTRFLLISFAIALAMAAVLVGMALYNGVSPTAPRFGWVFALGLIASLYVGLRIGYVIDKMLAPRDTAAPAKSSKTSTFKRWGRSEHLDSRMEARRRRVEAARARQDGETPPQD